MRSSFNIICSLSKWSLALMLGVVLSQTAVAAPGDIKTLAGGAAFDSPNGIHVTQSGDIYLADTFNHRVVKIGANGAISTVAGNGARGAAGDGGPAVAANLDGPINIAMDNAGILPAFARSAK
jgi:NHL repeat